MRKMRMLVFIFLIAVWALAGGCAATPKGSAEKGALAPKVELERVEVASYFPYDAKARVPLVLAFILKMDNPNDFKMELESVKFTVGFEAEGKKGEFFNLATPMAYESQFIPAKTANRLRVVTVIDSLVVPGNLAVTGGSRLAVLGLKIPEMVQYWYEKIGDFPFAIKVSEGSAVFNSDRGDVVCGFEGIFPKK